MERDVHSDALERLLTRQLAATRALSTVLEHETRSLTAGDPDEIRRIVEEKERLARELEDLSRGAFALLEAAGFTADRKGMEEYLRRHEPQERLVPLWNELLERIDQCRERNQANGAIVMLNQRSIQRALSILKGQLAEPDLYGPSGKTAGDTPGRSLAKA